MSIDRGLDKEDVVYTHTHTHTHTRTHTWNITQPLKRMKNAICNNMDGLRECILSEVRQKEGGEISYDIP